MRLRRSTTAGRSRRLRRLRQLAAPIAPTTATPLTALATQAAEQAAAPTLVGVDVPVDPLMAGQTGRTGDLLRAPVAFKIRLDAADATGIDARP